MLHRLGEILHGYIKADYSLQVAINDDLLTSRQHEAHTERVDVGQRPLHVIFRGRSETRMRVEGAQLHAHVLRCTAGLERGETKI